MSKENKSKRIKRYGAGLALAAAVTAGELTGGIIAHADEAHIVKQNTNDKNVKKVVKEEKTSPVIDDLAKEDLNTSIEGVKATVTTDSGNVTNPDMNANITKDTKYSYVGQQNLVSNYSKLTLKVPYKFSSKNGKIYKIDNPRIVLDCSAQYMGDAQGQTAKYKSVLERNLTYRKVIKLGDLNSTSTGVKNVDVDFYQVDHNVLYTINAKLVYSVNGEECTKEIQTPKLVGCRSYDCTMKPNIVSDTTAHQIRIQNQLAEVGAIPYNDKTKTLEQSKYGDVFYYATVAKDQALNASVKYSTYIQECKGCTLESKDISGLDDSVGYYTAKAGTTEVINIKNSPKTASTVKLSVAGNVQKVSDICSLRIDTSTGSYRTEAFLGKYHFEEDNEGSDGQCENNAGAEGNFSSSTIGMDINKLNVYSLNLLTNGTFDIYDTIGSYLYMGSYYHLTDEALNALSSCSQSEVTKIISSLIKGETTYGYKITKEMVTESQKTGKQLPVAQLLIHKLDSQTMSSRCRTLPLNDKPVISQEFTFGEATGDSAQNDILAQYKSELLAPNDIVDSKDGKLVDFLLVPNKVVNGVAQGETTYRCGHYDKDTCTYKFNASMGISLDGPYYAIKPGETCTISAKCQIPSSKPDTAKTFSIKLNSTGYKLLGIKFDDSGKILDASQYKVNGDTITITLNPDDFSDGSCNLDIRIGAITLPEGTPDLTAKAETSQTGEDKFYDIKANGTIYKIPLEFSLGDFSVPVVQEVKNSCSNSVVNVADNVATVVQSLQNDTNRETDYNIAGEFPNSDTNSLSAKLDDAGSKAKGHLVSIVKENGDMYLLESSHLNDKFNRDLLSNPATGLNVPVSELTEARGWYKYKAGMDVSKFGAYFIHLDNVKNCMGEFLVFKYQIDPSSPTDKLNCAFKYYDISNKLDSHSPVSSFTGKNMTTNYYGWKTTIYDEGQPASKDLLNKTLTLDGKKYTLADVLGQGNSLTDMKSIPDKVDLACKLMDPQILKQIGYGFIKCTVNGKEITPDALRSQGILFNKNFSDIKFYISQPVTTKIIEENELGNEIGTATITGAKGAKFKIIDMGSSNIYDFEDNWDQIMNGEHSITVNGQVVSDYAPAFGTTNQTVVIRKLGKIRPFKVNIVRCGKVIYTESVNARTGDKIDYKGLSKELFDQYSKHIQHVDDVDYYDNQKVMPTIVPSSGDVTIDLDNYVKVIVKAPNGSIVKQGIIADNDTNEKDVDLSEYLPAQNIINYISVDGNKLSSTNGEVPWDRDGNIHTIVIQEKQQAQAQINIKYVDSFSGKEVPSSTTSKFKLNANNGVVTDGMKVTDIDSLDKLKQYIGNVSLQQDGTRYAYVSYDLTKGNKNGAIQNYNLTVTVKPTVEIDYEADIPGTKTPLNGYFNVKAESNYIYAEADGPDEPAVYYIGSYRDYKAIDGKVYLKDGNKYKDLTELISNVVFNEEAFHPQYRQDTKSKPTITLKENSDGVLVINCNVPVVKIPSVKYDIKIINIDTGKITTEDFEGLEGDYPDIIGDVDTQGNIIKEIYNGKEVDLSASDDAPIYDPDDNPMPESTGPALQDGPNHFEVYVGNEHNANIDVKTIDTATGKIIPMKYQITVTQFDPMQSGSPYVHKDLTFDSTSKLGMLSMYNNGVLSPSVPGYKGKSYETYVKDNLKYTIPAGYITSKPTSYSYKLNKDGTETIEVINYVQKPSTTVKVEVVDSNGNYISGEHFKIFDGDKEIKDLTSSDKITEFTGEGINNWTVKAQGIPAGYVANGVPEISSTQNKYSKTITVIQRVKKFEGEIKIKTVDISTGKAYVGCTYDAVDSKGNTVVVYTDEDGKGLDEEIHEQVSRVIVSELPLGFKYAKPQSFKTYEQDGKTIYEVTNYVEPSAEIKIQAIDTTTNKPLTGVGFDIANKDYMTEHYVTSDKDDCAVVGGIAALNNNTISITSVPKNYQRVGDYTKTETVTKDGIKVITYTYKFEQQKTTVDAQATDSEGKALTGCKVLLSVDGKAGQEYNVVNGKIVGLDGLHTVKLLNVILPSGYQLVNTPSMTTKTANGVETYSIQIKAKQIKCTVKVEAKDADSLVAGVKFVAYDKDGKELASAVSNDKGFVTFQVIGSEVASVKAFSPQSDFKIFKLDVSKDGDTTTAIACMDRQVYFHINVLDADTGKVVDGCKVEFLNNKGEIIGSPYVVTGDKAIIGKQTPNNYIDKVIIIPAKDYINYGERKVTKYIDSKTGSVNFVENYFVKQEKTIINVKTVDEQGNEIAGQNYDITKDGKEVGTLTSDADKTKEVEWTGVGVDSYKVSVQNAPDGYVQQGQPKVTESTKNGVETINVISTVKRKTTQVNVSAVDEKGNSVDGVKFDIYSKDNKDLKDLLTNGKTITWNTVGTPVSNIKLGSLPKDYILEGNIDVQSKTVDGQTVINVIAHLKQKSTIVNIKAVDTKGNLVSNVGVNMIGQNGDVVKAVKTADKDLTEQFRGTPVSKLTVGNLPANYILNGEAKMQTSTKDGVTTINYIIPVKEVTTVVNVVAQDVETSKDVKGVNVDLVNNEGSIVKEVTTGDKEVSWSSVGTLNLTSKIKSIPNGYIQDGDIKVAKSEKDGVTTYDVIVGVRKLRDTTIKVSVIDENGVTLSGPTAYEGKENSSVNIKAPTIDSKYQIVNITDNNKVIKDLPTTYTKDNQTIIYHVKQVRSTVQVIVKDGDKLVGQTKPTSINIGQDLTNSLIPNDMIKDYNITSINVNGKNVGTSIEGKAIKAPNTIIVNVERKLYKSVVDVQAVDKDGKDISGAIYNIQSATGLNDTITTQDKTVSKEFNVTNLDKFKLTQAPQGYIQDGETKVVRTVNDGVITYKVTTPFRKIQQGEIIVKVLDNHGNQIGTTVTYKGLGFSKSDVKVPDINDDYDLVSITDNGKTITQLPKTFTEGTQEIIFHVVKVKTEVRVYVKDGNEYLSSGVEKVKVGSKFTDSLIPTGITKDYAISSVIVNGKNVGNTISGTAQENNNTIIINVNKKMTKVVIKAVDENNKNVVGLTYDIDGSNGSVIKNVVTGDKDSVVDFTGTPVSTVTNKGIPNGYIVVGKTITTKTEKDGLTTITVTTHVKQMTTKVVVKAVDVESGKDVAGGIYTITGKDSKTIAQVKTEDKDTTWTTKGIPVSKVQFSNLPTGYVQAGETKETTETKDGVMTITVTTPVKAIKNVVKVEAVDQNGKLVSGAKLDIMNNGKIDKTIMTGDKEVSQQITSAMLKDTLKATAPQGYVLNGKMDVNRSYKDGINTLTVKIHVKECSTIVNIKAVDQDGNLVPGISYKIVGNDKNVLDTLISGDKQVSTTIAKSNVQNILVGKLPAGYILNGETSVTKSTKDGVTTINVITPVKQMQTVVSVSAVDSKTGKEVSGVKFNVTDKTGKELSTLITGNTTTWKTKGIPVYKVAVGSIPKGYKLVGDVKLSTDTKDGVMTIKAVATLEQEAKGIINVVAKDAEGNVVVPLKSYSGYQGQKADIQSPLIPKGYTIYAIYVNGKKVDKLPNTFNPGTDNVVYVLKKVTSTIKVIIKCGDTVIKDYPAQNIKVGAKLDDSLLPKDMPTGYTVDKIVTDGVNTGKHISGIAIPNGNQVTIYVTKDKPVKDTTATKPQSIPTPEIKPDETHNTVPVKPSKPTQGETDKTTTDKPTKPSKTEDKPVADKTDKPTADKTTKPSKTEDKTDKTTSTSKAEDKTTNNKTTSTSKTEDKTTNDKTTQPTKGEDKTTSTSKTEDKTISTSKTEDKKADAKVSKEDKSNDKSQDKSSVSQGVINSDKTDSNTMDIKPVIEDSHNLDKGEVNKDNKGILPATGYGVNAGMEAGGFSLLTLGSYLFANFRKRRRNK